MILPLTVIVGPTAAGKSQLALNLAESRGGEIVNADSMQVYRYFDIGTGKPSTADRQRVPHHLLDIVEPDQSFSAAQFVATADPLIQDIHNRGKKAIVVGGSGLYVRALLHGLFAAPPAHPEIRSTHQRIYAEQGVDVLYARLSELDPTAAQRIHPRDFVRISRALEVYELTGEPISEQQQRHAFAPDRYAAEILALDPGADLRSRIDRRVDEMVAAGWLDEVRALHQRGFQSSHPMGALGYRHLSAHLAGTLDFTEAIRQTKRDTWNFARRQRNWFRGESHVQWVASPEAVL